MPSWYRSNSDNPATPGVQYRRTAVLMCGHVRIFEPLPKSEPGAAAWCQPCGERRRLLLVREDWAVRCEQCPYARFYAEDERAAARALGRHKAIRPNHSVCLFHNGKLDQRLGNAGANTLPGILPGLDDDGSQIPF